MSAAADFARVKAHLQEALKQCRHLQDLVVRPETGMGCAASSSMRSQGQPEAIPHAMPRGAEQSAVHSGATSQQTQTSRERLELSVELEKARQQIVTLQQVLSLCYLHNFVKMLSLF